MSYVPHDPPEANPAAIRLLRLDDMPDGDGLPRGGLLLPPTLPGRRPILMMFGSVAAAVAAKRDLEGGRR
jgi:hypothetical protein